MMGMAWETRNLSNPYIDICKRNLYVLFDMAAFCIKVLIVLIVLNFQNNILNY